MASSLLVRNSQELQRTLAHERLLDHVLLRRLDVAVVVVRRRTRHNAAGRRSVGGSGRRQTPGLEVLEEDAGGGEVGVVLEVE